MENARRRFDLAIVSVLLDAGAGPDWQYHDNKTGIVCGRSEGLALASIRLVESGLLSLHGQDDPFRVDAEPLKRLSSQKGIKVEFQSIPEANHFFSKNESSLVKFLDKYIKKETALY